jgi:hypothetical protein
MRSTKEQAHVQVTWGCLQCRTLSAAEALGRGHTIYGGMCIIDCAMIAMPDFSSTWLIWNISWHEIISIIAGGCIFAVSFWRPHITALRHLRGGARRQWKHWTSVPGNPERNGSQQHGDVSRDTSKLVSSIECLVM